MFLWKNCMAVNTIYRRQPKRETTQDPDFKDMYNEEYFS